MLIMVLLWFYLLKGTYVVKNVNGNYIICENTCSWSYYRHQFVSLTHLPLFRVTSWNTGMHSMSFYVLIQLKASALFTKVCAPGSMSRGMYGYLVSYCRGGESLQLWCSNIKLQYSRNPMRLPKPSVKWIDVLWLNFEISLFVIYQYWMKYKSHHTLSAGLMWFLNISLWNNVTKQYIILNWHYLFPKTYFTAWELCCFYGTQVAGGWCGK